MTSPHNLSVEPFTETGAASMLVDLARVLAHSHDSLGWGANNFQALLPAWRSGLVRVLTDRVDGELTGAAVIMLYRSPLHAQDAVIALLAPAQGRAPELLAFAAAVAQANGAAGVACAVDVAGAVGLAQVLTDQGFAPKAVTYGRKL